VHRLVSVVLILLGTVLAVASWGPLQNLFAEYRDGTAVGYLVLGVPLLIVGAILLVVGIQGLIRPQSRP
jgi:hypothetical protein